MNPITFIEASIRACAYPVEDIVAAVRALGGPGSGNFGHAGRPGEVGGSASKFDVTTIGQALENAGRVTTNPNETAFLLPDGTRVSTAGYNSHSKLAMAAGYNDLNRVIESGIVRYIPGVGVEANHLTETQARIIVDLDIEPVRGLMPGRAMRLDFPHFFDTLREANAVIREAGALTPEMQKQRLRAAGGPGSGNFGHAGRPGEVGGSAPSDAITSTPAFKSWFGDSAVTDDNNNPLVVYHATNADPTTFRSGTHFGTAAAANKRFEDLYSFSVDTVKRDPGRFQVVPVYLKIENPLRLPDLASLPEDDGTLRPDIDEAPESRAWENEGDLTTTLYERDIITRDEFWEYQYKRTEQLFPLLKEKGYDGIVYKNAFEDKGSDSWIVFDASQVKSAIANRTFDPEKDLITAGGPGSGNFGHAGRPGHVGGSTSESALLDRETATKNTPSSVMRTMALPRSLKDAEDRIRSERNEHAYTFFGDVALEYYGQDVNNHVRLPKEGTLGGVGDPLVNVTFTHNHPSGSGLSPDDVFVAASHNMQEMRATNNDGTHSAQLVGKKWPDPHFLFHRAQVENTEVHREFTRRIRVGELTPAQANRQHWPEVWKRVAESAYDGGLVKDLIKFSFEPRT